ncbi:ROK family glucokinase [Priestia aryabhattai]
MKNKSIGIDIGGTTVKVAFFEVQGECLAKWSIPTDKTNNGVNIIADINETVNSKMIELGLNKDDFIGVGIGVPGFIDYETGSIAHAPNIPWNKNYPLKRELENVLGLPVELENDANLAAMGEMWLGAGKGKQNVVMVTLGTGVGGGIIVNGNVVRGSNGMGGEIGHIFSKDNGIICGCGKEGCLETIASATGIVRLAEAIIEEYVDSTILYDLKQQKGRVETKDVFEAASNGDSYALSVVEESMKYLGIALSHIIHTNNPEVIVIGGGVSKAGSFLLEQVQKQVEKYTLPRAYEVIKFELATLGNEAGVIGGAHLTEKFK